MEERSEMNRSDEALLPGFRFHPTDEELVAFYLKRKIQQKALAIELIRQLDIYKYEPWDLPNLAATTGEKEWYFYCPRGRKYRNSSRPNRVTMAGFWKATGTDRPVYSSEGTKCIGLKKSLVFYKGRAGKGTKTDWMMHEFRLPSSRTSLEMPPHTDKNIHPNDTWAICRIFKKTNSMAQRTLNQSMVHPQIQTKSTDDMFSIPNSPMHDIKNPVCYPTLDCAAYRPSMLLNFSTLVARDVERASMCTGLQKFEAIDELVNGGEESGRENHENTFYMGTDQLESLEAIDFPSIMSWDSPSCLSVDTSRSWPSEKCYNPLDDLIQ